MDVRRRNMLVLAARIAIGVVLAGWIVIMIGRVDLSAALATAALIALTAMSQYLRHQRQARRSDKRAGEVLDANAQAEKPIPLMPLTRNRNELAAGIVFLVLLVVVFVLYYTGAADHWLTHWR
jgi:Kef-type K+ transport system membrane component KefB